MMTNRFLKFAHRQNPDGTYDSICSRCFQTIATVRDEDALQRIEGRHNCDPNLLARYWQMDSEDKQEA